MAFESSGVTYSELVRREASIQELYLSMVIFSLDAVGKIYLWLTKYFSNFFIIVKEHGCMW
jgi:hypothetical protein